MKTTAQQITPKIHKVEIPEMIGERVVYNEEYLADGVPCTPLPECGFFIITLALRFDDGNIMVRTFPILKLLFRDGTNISLRNLKRYEPDKRVVDRAWDSVKRCRCELV